MQVVAVVGASENPQRASNLACKLLRQKGHTAYAVSLHGRDIHGATGVTSLAEIDEPIDTITLYMGAQRQAPMIDAIIASKPRRVIFNPGAESPETQGRLSEAGIETIHACTLVLLTTNQFDR
jgi:predicted CoA-binding protein